GGVSHGCSARAVGGAPTETFARGPAPGTRPRDPRAAVTARGRGRTCAAGVSAAPTRTTSSGRMRATATCAGNLARDKAPSCPRACPRAMRIPSPSAGNEFCHGFGREALADAGVGCITVRQDLETSRADGLFWTVVIAVPTVRQPGSVLGGYQLLERLAVGGMAEIFLARKVAEGGFEKTVVVKRILPQLAENDEFVRMFLDEARLAAQLHHPNITQVYDIGVEEGAPFFVMEWVQGRDMRDVMQAAAG